MTAKLKTLDTAASWSTPTDDEIRAWEALPREEQLAQLRALFDSSECNEASRLTFAEIIAAARLKARPSRDG